MGVDETRIRMERVQNITTPAHTAGPAANGSLVVGASGGFNESILTFRNVTAPHVDVTVVNHFHQTLNYTEPSRDHPRGLVSSRGNVGGDRRAGGGRGRGSSHAARDNVITGPAESVTDLAIDNLDEWPSLPPAALPSI